MSRSRRISILNQISSLFERAKTFVKTNKPYVAATGTGLFAGGSVAVLGAFFVPGLNIVAAGVATIALIACAAIVAAAIVTGLIFAGIKLFQFISAKREEAQRSLEQQAVITSSLEQIMKNSSVNENSSAFTKAMQLRKKDDIAEPVVLTASRGVRMDASQGAGKHALFAIPVVPLPDKDNVVLTDGTQVPKEKAEAVYEKLKLRATDTQSEAAFSIVYMTCKSKDFRTLVAQSNNKAFNCFRAQDEEGDNEYPIIKSDNTIDEETRRIILCATKNTGARVEIVDPMLHAPASAFKK